MPCKNEVADENGRYRYNNYTPAEKLRVVVEGVTQLWCDGRASSGTIDATGEEWFAVRSRLHGKGHQNYYTLRINDVVVGKFPNKLATLQAMVKQDYTETFKWGSADESAQ